MEARRRVVSIRFIVTVVAVGLVSAGAVGAGLVYERNVRRVLTPEIEFRLLLEARNLAVRSSDALLDKYPEMVLHPMIKELQAQRPELAYVEVVDVEGVIQGHSQARLLGQKRTSRGLAIRKSGDGELSAGEQRLDGNDLTAIRVPIRHPNGQALGAVHIGLHRSYIEGRIASTRRAQMVVLAGILLASVLVTSGLMRGLLGPVRELRRGLDRIGTGQLDQPVEVSGRTELGLLAESVNDMAAKLKTAQMDMVEKKRLDYEMGLASRIQTNLLPSGNLTLGAFVVGGFYQAAAEVGGDYFDVFELPEEKVSVAIADVAGKGLAGCMVTSMLAALLGALRPRYSSPSELLMNLEELLAKKLEPGVFITMFYGILDTHSNTLTFASAAHSPTLVYRARTRSVDRYGTDGIPLCAAPGGMLARTLRDNQMFLEAGDLLLQYTDGINETFAESSDEEFGFDRVTSILSRNAQRGLGATVESLIDAVGEWSGSRAVGDDRTLLCISHERDVAAAGEKVAATVSALFKLPSRETLIDMMRPDAHLRLPAQLNALQALRDWVAGCVPLDKLGSEDRARVELVLYELCANLIEHGYAAEADDEIDIWWLSHASENSTGDHRARASKSYFVIRDSGRPFENPVVLRSNRRPVQHTRGRGLGLALIHAASEPRYFPDTPAGNLTVLQFQFEPTHHEQRVPL